jgi:hypothetical protein
VKHAQLRVEYDLVCWTVEQDSHLIEYVSTKNPLGADEIALQATGVFLSVDHHPIAKQQSHRRTARNAGHLNWRRLRYVELKLLAVGPRKRTRVRTGIGNHSIQDDAGLTAERTKLDWEDWQRFDRIRRTIRKACSSHSARLFLATDASHEGMACRRFRGMKNNGGAVAGGDNAPSAKPTHLPAYCPRSLSRTDQYPASFFRQMGLICFAISGGSWSARLFNGGSK